MLKLIVLTLFSINVKNSINDNSNGRTSCEKIENLSKVKITKNWLSLQNHIL